ncbi:MAG: right-handed parallel beta-helix repeat-containing protein [Prolixibacteraceae bacterium]|jgi:hypothetical protein|nr:right-handed parallel beta-helix repeat-containing protein [Prolixibacteraceae bacterium]
MRLSFHITILFLAVFSFVELFGQTTQEKPLNPFAVSTYECSSIYWETPEAGICKIRYKEVLGNSWKEGLELVYDARDSEYRGSLVGLAPNTEYQAELSTASSKTKLKFKTRNDNFQIGKTTILPTGESDTTVVITESGTPEAYHLVTVPENAKSVLNLRNTCNYGIEIDADFVILRGVEIRNAKIHGIRVRANRHDIVIEQCHLAFWGRMGGPISYGNFDGNSDSGIWADSGTENITVQRNLIEDPRGASNDWETGHPSGPQGVTIIQSRGGNVIRYNDIVTTEDHGFNDAIGGANNFSFEGNMNRNSDIYGNIIRGAWDDAIESEGANMNVRIWGNYLHRFFNGIASACTSRGPLYCFRNVFGESRTGHRNSIGGSLFKLGGRNEFAGGKRFLFHNTALQPNGAYNAFSNFSSELNCVHSRNNIFDTPGRMATNREKEPLSIYDYDYFPGSQEEHGIRVSTTPSGTRLFVESYKLEFYPRVNIISINWGVQPNKFGDLKVKVTDPLGWVKNPMIDGGVVIPGFNDDFKGSAPDAGAFEVGAPPLQFGRRAYLGYDEGWCPWEKF